MAESASNILPFREKEKGDPGKKVEDRSPMTRSEGCSRSCWTAVRAEREASSFFISVALFEEGDGAGAGMGDAATVGLGVELLLPLLLERGIDDDLVLLLLEDFFFSSFSFSTSL